jgi:WD40 repeat protein
MKNKQHLLVLALLINCQLSYFLCIAQSPVTVWTHRYNNLRTGWNDQETVLNTNTVNQRQFGLLFTRPVDDQLYAQPLIVPNLNFGGTVQSAVFLATVNNTVYAYNATDAAAPAPLWSVNLTTPGARVIRNTDMTGACGGFYKDFSGNMGIVGTPVIDTVTKTMYLVTRDISNANGTYRQYLHALDILTGQERTGSPVGIAANYLGTGAGATFNFVPFEPQKENQRPALLLHNGTVYICWASHCDWGPYHGWVLGYNAADLQLKYIYNTTPDGENGGIWMSGAGPVVDGNGNIYLTTGNGTVGVGNNPNNPRNRGESLLKLREPTSTQGNQLQLINFFTPADYAYLETNDLDYGVDGVLLIPNTNLCLSGSKQGKIYVNDVNKMGKCTPANDSVVQVLYVNVQTVAEKHIHGTPLYYKYRTTVAVDSEFVYAWAESDYLTQIPFNRTTKLFETTATKKGNIKLDTGMPGSMITASSNSDVAGSGIIWASHPLSGNANQALRPGSLDAYDARDITRPLFRSNVNTLDDPGYFSKFNNPIVANGKVYLPTFSNKLNVYGILPTPRPNAVAEINSNPLDLHIYPNPTTADIKITYTPTQTQQGLTIKIIDILGKTIHTTQANGTAGTHQQTISLANFPTGVYQIVLELEGQVLQTAKVIKNN